MSRARRRTILLVGLPGLAVIALVYFSVVRRHPGYQAVGGQAANVKDAANKMGGMVMANSEPAPAPTAAPPTDSPIFVAPEKQQLNLFNLGM